MNVGHIHAYIDLVISLSVLSLKFSIPGNAYVLIDVIISWNDESSTLTDCIFSIYD
jgi:hypothetical protein